MIRRARLALLLLFFSLARAGQARAEDTEDLQALLSENVVTTASTAAERASTAPATSVTITAEDLRRYGIRTLAEAIDFLGVGLVTSDPLRTPDVGARGVLLRDDAGKHLLLLVNGHAINDPLLGAARFDEGAGIPMDVVDHVEVIVGPGSVLYGSDAMLGVINVITKSASDYAGAHLVGDYEIARTGHVSAGAGATFRLFGVASEWTAAADYTSRFGPDLEMGTVRTPVNQGTGQLITYRRGGPADGVWGGTLRDAYFTQAPSGFLRLRVGDVDVSLMGSVYRRGIPYTTQSLNVDFDDPASYEMDRAVRLDVKHEATLNALVHLSSRAYVDSFDYQRQVNRNAAAGCFRTDIATCSFYDAALARWVGLEERLSLNWLAEQNLVTLVGIDTRLRWVRAKQDALDFDTNEPFAPSAGLIHDSASPLVSPYVQQTWSPTTFLDLNAGARLDADARFSPIVSPRGAVAWTPFDKTTFRAIYSQAFRAPTWFETDSASYSLAPSDKIQPETVRSLEGSIEQRFSTQRVLFGVFESTWENIVELSPVTSAELAVLQRQNVEPIAATSVSRYHNVSGLRNFGWNAIWEGSLARNLTYGASATEAFTRRTAPGEPDRRLVVAPQLFGNAHIAYVFGGFLPTPALAVHYVGARPLDRTYDDPFYATLPEAKPMADIRLTLSGEVPAIPGLGYRLGAALATASHGPYVVGPIANYQNPPLTPGMPTNPVDRIRFMVGLRYDFFTGTQPSSGGLQ